MPSNSPIHEISDQYVADYARLDPIVASGVGVPGYDDQLTDYSPDGVRARADLARAAVRAMAAQTPADSAERVAQAVFLERLNSELALHDADLLITELNSIASPAQWVREIFDLMATETVDDWATIAARLAAVPEAVAGIIAAQRYGIENGGVAAVRQVERVADQCDVWAGRKGSTGSFFATLVDQVDGVPGVTEALRADLRTGADRAAGAYADLAGFLRGELAPHARLKDAVGAEHYGLALQYFTGASVNVPELYQWGWEEFFRIETEMKQVANRISPGATLAEAAAALDADPRYRLDSQDALRKWMQRLSDEALASLRDKHFTIPDPVMKLECLIAPPGGGIGAYYTGPTADFGRPGRMWWSLPADRQEFSTWREVTTVYHEGAPGHHLQIATAVYQADTLNKYQRLFAGTSGHCEGWALYAERLMRELGYLADDGELMGMLDTYLFRAARVIVDIGMHLELPIPAGTGFHEGERWTPQLGLEFMRTRTIQDPVAMADEIDRYLGWPGQAPSYKLGERYWLIARDEAKQRHPESFDLRTFHQRALEMGSMGLDTLRERLADL